MAAVPLIVCNPATSWYDFAYPLSWSNKCEVAEVLSDIPFISVGILVFGISTLSLAMKRVSISAVWLFLSAVQAFIAAVLDLGQTLADGMAMNSTFTANEPAIRAREILFALSIGFRFLFYWSYVAEPPRKDLSAVSTQTVQKVNFLALECTHGPHSGSWTRWGLPGKLLGVGLLVAIITITALQIVWRVVPQFHQYSSVYGVDAALELFVSFLLLLRLLSNTLTLNSPNNMLVHTFRECLAPISGLLVNIAIGVGDLLCFAFTESTVGRLLQAFEVCIIVIFAMIAAFLRHRDILSTTSLQDRKHRDVVFTLPQPARRSTFRITLPLIETPRMSTILGTAIQNKESSREMPRRSMRRSLNHVSSWVSSKVSRNRAPHEDEEVRLWNAKEVKADPPYTGNMVTQLVHSSVSSTQESKELLRDASANHISIVSALDSQSAIVRSMEGSVYSGQIAHPSRADTLQRTIPSPNSPGVKYMESTAAAPQASPVYGISGIQPHASASDSQTSLDELLRQQSQLDRSIEVLGLFSARSSPNPSYFDATTSPRSVALTRSSSTGQRTISSEVSLSSFPVPPWLTTPVPPPPLSRPSSVKRIRGNRQARFAVARPTPVRDTHASASPMTSASLVDIPSSPCFKSIPYSPLGEESESHFAEAGKFSRSDSGGMQYNVTSFIGGLATPGEPRQGSQEKSRWPIEIESSAETIQAGSGVKKLSPLARSSGPSKGGVVNEPANIVQYQTDDQTSCALPVVLSTCTPVTDHAEKGTAIPSTGPQLVRETGPPLTVSAEGANRVRKMFVRPRPPPLVIQSYTEQNPDMSRVRVLADD